MHRGQRRIYSICYERMDTWQWRRRVPQHFVNPVGPHLLHRNDAHTFYLTIRSVVYLVPSCRAFSFLFFHIERHPSKVDESSSSCNKQFISRLPFDITFCIRPYNSPTKYSSLLKFLSCATMKMATPRLYIFWIYVIIFGLLKRCSNHYIVCQQTFCKQENQLTAFPKYGDLWHTVQLKV